MRAFNKDGKINFVDHNNVLVGFDMQSSCCESFGWGLKDPMDVIIGSDADGDKLDGVNLALALFAFDTGFCEKQDANSESAQVRFRLIGPSGEHAYLTLFNHHNGYHGHGFDMEIGGKSIWGGVL